MSYSETDLAVGLARSVFGSADSPGAIASILAVLLSVRRTPHGDARCAPSVQTYFSSTLALFNKFWFNTTYSGPEPELSLSCHSIV